MFSIFRLSLFPSPTTRVWFVGRWSMVGAQHGMTVTSTWRTADGGLTNNLAQHDSDTTVVHHRSITARYTEVSSNYRFGHLSISMRFGYGDWKRDFAHQRVQHEKLNRGAQTPNRESPGDIDHRSFCKEVAFIFIALLFIFLWWRSVVF